MSTSSCDSGRETRPLTGPSSGTRCQGPPSWAGGPSTLIHGDKLTIDESRRTTTKKNLRSKSAIGGQAGVAGIGASTPSGREDAAAKL